LLGAAAREFRPSAVAAERIVNIVAPILLQCRYQPDALAICAPGTPLNMVSYGRLEKLINNVAARAASLGLAQGNVVAVVIDDPIVHAVVTLGLARLGIATLSAKSSEFPAGLRVDAVVTERPWAEPRSRALFRSISDGYRATASRSTNPPISAPTTCAGSRSRQARPAIRKRLR
jgi:acyl-CoA synthetase (AMP-forming)/AMP-acid ligase II